MKLCVCVEPNKLASPLKFRRALRRDQFMHTAGVALSTVIAVVTNLKFHSVTSEISFNIFVQKNLKGSEKRLSLLFCNYVNDICKLMSIRIKKMIQYALLMLSVFIGYNFA